MPIGDLVKNPIGDLVDGFTPKKESKTGVAFSTGEFVGSTVTDAVGDGDGGLLFSLHSGDHIALSLQYADPLPQNP